MRASGRAGEGLFENSGQQQQQQQQAAAVAETISDASLAQRHEEGDDCPRVVAAKGGVGT